MHVHPGALPPIAAYLLAADRAEEIDWAGIDAWQPAQGFLWIHLNRTEPSHTRWLEERSGLDRLSCDILLEEETRPRHVAVDGNLLVILRGVNLQPGEEPDDMVSLRLWIGRDRLVSLRRREVGSIADVCADLRAGARFGSPSELFLDIVDRLIDRQVPVLDELEEIVDTVEEALLDGGRDERRRIGGIRRQAIGIRRYLAPQRDLLLRLSSDRSPVFDDSCRARLREVAERQARLVEELDAVRDRAALASEEYMSRISERLNRNMYVLSLVAAVFLPMSFVTGLLGINVGGIPGAEHGQAFWIVVGGLAVVGTSVLLLFRRFRMM